MQSNPGQHPGMRDRAHCALQQNQGLSCLAHPAPSCSLFSSASGTNLGSVLPAGAVRKERHGTNIFKLLLCSPGAAGSASVIRAEPRDSPFPAGELPMLPLPGLPFPTANTGTEWAEDESMPCTPLLPLTPVPATRTALGIILSMDPGLGAKGCSPAVTNAGTKLPWICFHVPRWKNQCP